MEKLLFPEIIVVLEVIVMRNSGALASLLVENTVDCTQFDVIFAGILLLDAECLGVNSLIDKSSFRIINFLFNAGVADVRVVKSVHALFCLGHA